ncbi:MAG: KdsC family phosphatase [Candidatus Melainabacteria bacterium]
MTVWPDQERLAAIQLVAMDVDGVLTDGKITYTSHGEELKSFNVKDGLGITLAHRAGIQTAIITARCSAIVTRRAEELEIEAVYQGAKDKLAALTAVAARYRLPLHAIAYMGDDLPDMPALAACGLPLCPADAAPEVVTLVAEKSGMIAQSNGGAGAVRECLDRIRNARPVGQRGLPDAPVYACQPS